MYAYVYVIPWQPVSVNNCKGELEVLKSFADLNVPDWAVDFMASMPFSANIVMLGEAASALGIVMYATLF